MNQHASTTQAPTTRVPPASSGNDAAARMRAAIAQAVAGGPAFLRGDIAATQMAHAMTGAVRAWATAAQAAGDDPSATAETRQMQQVLGELMGCGSGFLAGRCDAACVARTMTWMVEKFPPA